MANKDLPFGFRALRNEAGTTPSINEYVMASSVTAYEGAIMAVNTTGNVEMFSAAAQRQRILGAAVHPKTAVDTDRKILVYDDPRQEYEAQIDDNSVTTLGGLIGKNFIAITPASGNGTTLQSISEIDGSSGTSTNNTTVLGVFKGLRFSSSSENTQTSTFTRIVVKINPENHVFASEGTAVI